MVASGCLISYNYRHTADTNSAVENDSSGRFQTRHTTPNEGKKSRRPRDREKRQGQEEREKKEIAERQRQRQRETYRHTVTDREQGKVDCQEKGGEEICLPTERKGKQKDGSREGPKGGLNKRTEEVRIGLQ